MYINKTFQVRNILPKCRSMPGPAIVVCKDDDVMVDVINTMATETTSIHFHGKLAISQIQKDSKYFFVLIEIKLCAKSVYY